MNREELLAKYSDPIRVLDDGFVRLVDAMGDDQAVVAAARISYGAGTKTVSDDTALIRYLMRHAHSTPFESCVIKLHWRAPMDVMRQAIRHRTMSLIHPSLMEMDEPAANEYSTRYSVAIDAAQKTDPGKWRLQSKSNKQGSSGYLSVDGERDPDCEIHVHSMPDGRCTCKLGGESLSHRENVLQDMARSTYEKRLELGVAREQARKDLPLSTYTEMYTVANLWNTFHFLRLRLDEHAQEEIRDFAVAISAFVAEWVPACWDAFMSYMRYSVTFSREELALLGDILRGQTAPMSYAAWLKDKTASTGTLVGLSKREAIEFEAKLKRIIEDPVC